MIQSNLWCFIGRLKSTLPSDKTTSTIGLCWRNANLTMQSIIDQMSRDEFDTPTVHPPDQSIIDCKITDEKTSMAELCSRRMTQRKIRVAELVSKWNVAVTELVNATKKRSDEKILPLVETGGQNGNGSSPVITVDKVFSKQLIKNCNFCFIYTNFWNIRISFRHFTQYCACMDRLKHQILVVTSVQVPQVAWKVTKPQFQSVPVSWTVRNENRWFETCKPLFCRLHSIPMSTTAWYLDYRTRLHPES